MAKTSNKQPLISVLLPAYNEAKYLRRAVDSILAQTYKDFELILLDDGSTDETWEIIEEYDDPRLRKVRLDRRGFTAALNHGLSISRGEYIARMDADDESLPERLAKQATFLNTHPEISIVGTAYYKYDALRNEQFIRRHPSTDQEIRQAMALYHPICHGTVMFRKNVINKIGGYGDLPTASDLELWLRAARYFKFANLNEPLYIYYFNPHHSYFEDSLGHMKRVMISAKLHARAIDQFKLPAYYYLIMSARWIYYLFLPTKFKRFVRNLVSLSKEEPISSDHLAR